MANDAQNNDDKVVKKVDEIIDKKLFKKVNEMIERENEKIVKKVDELMAEIKKTTE